VALATLCVNGAEPGDGTDKLKSVVQDATPDGDIGGTAEAPKAQDSLDVEPEVTTDKLSVGLDATANGATADASKDTVDASKDTADASKNTADASKDTADASKDTADVVSQKLAASSDDEIPASEEESSDNAVSDSESAVSDAVTDAAAQLASDDGGDQTSTLSSPIDSELASMNKLGAKKSHKDVKTPDSKSSEESLGEAKDDKAPKKVGKGEAFIPLSPTIPKLTVLDAIHTKGKFHITNEAKRQFVINDFADISATKAGAAIFGGNMHVLNVKEKDEFRFSNTHGQMGGIGFATNFPHYNKASIVGSGSKSSARDGSFAPKTVATFTGNGNVGIGVDGPASRLHVHGDGNTRMINVNHWGDLSACASGVGVFGGNAYVTTEGNEAQFRYSNSHSSMGAMGFAVNYPEWNTASVITSGTGASESKKGFKPKAIITYTSKGLVGVGTAEPKSALDIRADKRQLSVNNWLDISSQGSAGFIGLNAHMVQRDSKRFFAFSNTAKTMGAIGMATNFPLINQLSIVSSPEGSSSAGTLFKPQTIATFTREGLVGFGTDAPKAKVDVRHATDRQISANKYADVSANEQLQGFFGGNGYAVGQGFNFANTNAVAGAVGLATHYPKPGEAAIISSGQDQPKAGAVFKPVVLAQFKHDGTLELPKNIVVAGDLKVSGRILNGDDDTEYDFMAAQETLVEENSRLAERLSKMETMLMSLMESR